MPALVPQLKKEHEFLVEKIGELRKFAGTEKAAKALRAIERGLVAHLKKEDEQLYPVLYAAAQDEPKLATRLAAFATEMEQITAAAIAFIEKYSDADGKATGSDGFVEELDGVTQVLAKRIAAEETVLYKDFQRLEAKYGVQVAGGDDAVVLDESTQYSNSTVLLFASLAGVAALVMLFLYLG